MDPFLISLIWAIGFGISSVVGKLADKGIVEPLLEPATKELKKLVKGDEQPERETKLVDAVRAAIEDSTRDLSWFRANVVREKPKRSLIRSMLITSPDSFGF